MTFERGVIDSEVYGSSDRQAVHEMIYLRSIYIVLVFLAIVIFTYGIK